jgi:hypothetical protein
MSSGMTVQVVSHETGKEDNRTWTKLMVLNSRGRFHAKFHGPKAEKLTRDLLATLADGETIGTKRLFIELFGEFTSFTRPGSTFKVRYFKAEDYKVINGPALELARLRGDALQVLQQAETLRNAGAFAQAYKAIATYAAELAQYPLDLSELAVDDALLGQISEEDYNPEAAAAAHYERQEAIAQSEAAAEDVAITDDIPVGPGPDDLDEVVLSGTSAEAVEDVPEADSLQAPDDQMAEDDDFSSDDNDEAAADEDAPADDLVDAEDGDHAEDLAEETAPPPPVRTAPRPFSRFNRRP